MLHTTLSMEQIAKRGEELYEASIRRNVEIEFDGKIVAIDVDSGDYEVDDTTLPAVDRLKIRQPDAGVYILRIGHDAGYTFHGLYSKRAKH